MTAAPPPPPPAASFAVRSARVAPARAFFGARPVGIAFRFAAGGPVDLRVRITRRGGRLARVYALPARAPGPVRLRWDLLTTHGKAAPDGRYRITVGPRGGALARLGAVRLRGHLYPVRGAHGFRGAIGTFGAPRNGGRRHEGFDINAACGTPVVAARAGTVTRRRYDPVLYGNLVIVHGSHERRDYWYAHLRSPGRVREGAKVRTGQRLGDVGATGNARTVGCHLHFELHGPGGPFDPLPLLGTWDGWS